jgi:flagellar assembly factor FliW
MSATAQSTPGLPGDQLSPEAADAAILFPEGLVGCPEWQRFVQVLDSDEDLPVAILQCLDDAAVQLIVTDPALVEPDYAAPLSSRERAELSLPSDVQPVVYCTLSITADGAISANLLGPLVVNPVTRRGLQLVLTESGYSSRHPVAHMAASAEGQAD